MMRKFLSRPRPSRPRTVGGVFAISLVVALTACAPSEPEGSSAEEHREEQESESTAAAAQGDEEAHHRFVTRPDLVPPEITTSAEEVRSSDEYTFLTPSFDDAEPSSGAMIFDAGGQPVWIAPSDDEDPDDNYLNLRPQEYRGGPVLTAYEGFNRGWGHGDIVLLDESYEELTRVTTAGSLGPGYVDFHDTTITDEGTMLVAAYIPTRTDLTSIGGPADGYVLNAVVQEIDIETGAALFEWSALDHVPVSDTRQAFDAETTGTEDNPFDYFHVNSITEDGDDSLLISARHTHSVYRVDRATGAVEWTLGGASNDFDVDDDAEFAWQHDARRAADGTLTLFDNHTASSESDDSSRGVRLGLDEEAMTASLVTEYTPPEHRPAATMATIQDQENGNVLVGWGQQPYYSEYTRDGELISDAFHGGKSYRAYQAPWQGRPSADPDMVVQDEGGESIAYASWNGATEVASWRLVTGDEQASATPEEAIDRDGFETALPLDQQEAPYVAVEALDAEGEVLATTGA